MKSIAICISQIRVSQICVSQIQVSQMSVSQFSVSQVPLHLTYTGCHFRIAPSQQTKLQITSVLHTCTCTCIPSHYLDFRLHVVHVHIHVDNEYHVMWPTIMASCDTAYHVTWLTQQDGVAVRVRVGGQCGGADVCQEGERKRERERRKEMPHLSGSEKPVQLPQDSSCELRVAEHFPHHLLHLWSPADIDLGEYLSLSLSPSLPLFSNGILCDKHYDIIALTMPHPIPSFRSHSFFSLSSSVISFEMTHKYMYRLS